MKINKQELIKVAKYNSKDFNDFVMNIKDLDELDALLVFMLKNSHKTRIFRVYGRYSMIRKEQEREMISGGGWYE